MEGVNNHTEEVKQDRLFEHTSKIANMFDSERHLKQPSNEANTAAQLTNALKSKRESSD